MPAQSQNLYKELPDGLIDERWQHQTSALKKVIDHLNSVDKDETFLIRMPTGTGKSGVIACLSMLSCKGNTLVVTPWKNLREQMAGDLHEKFWKTAGIKRPDGKISEIFPKDLSAILKTEDSKVLVLTFNALNTIRREHPLDYQKLAKYVSLVLVDEGHYEPAVGWKKSVKGLNAQTVLMTATPYRNDLKLFQIKDPEKATHHFTHEDAVKNGIIREVVFENISVETDVEHLVLSFLKSWGVAKKNGELPSKHPRAIICCSSHSDIRKTVKLLRDKKVDAIGFHDQFTVSDKSDNLFKDVVDPLKESAEVWVHQNKLSEGLDDSRFCALALFCQIKNDRKLIQQIGRVLRLKSDDQQKPAIVYAPDAFSPEDEWSAYLQFETNIKLLNPKHFRDAVEKVLDAQPDVEYFDGRFRRKFDRHKLEKDPQVVIAPSVLVRRKSNNFNLDAYISDCTDTLNVEDAVILGEDLNKPCKQESHFALWVYASVSNSRFLQRTSLYEIKLETHCIVQNGDHVFISDSGGNYPHEYLESHTTDPGVDVLAKYIDDSYRPTNTSIQSTIPYDTAIRGAEIRGHDLKNVASTLTDRVNICRSVRGSSPNERRYVGLTNGRLRKELTESVRRDHTLEEFILWTNRVSDILSSPICKSGFFDRFMPICSPPASEDDAIPKTICLDIQRTDVKMHLSDGTDCFFVASSADFKEDHSTKKRSFYCEFKLREKTNGPVLAKPLKLHVEYQEGRGRFWFKKDKKSETVLVEVEYNGKHTERSFTEFLNMRQDIALICLEDGKTVYQGRSFYEVDYKHAESSLLDLIETPAAAKACHTEKGNKAELAKLVTDKATEFLAGSLFREIADGNIDLPFQPELMICDDMSSECADFVAVDFKNKKCALIHAKVGQGSGISASAFHDVVAQAMKNLCYLIPNPEAPKGVGSWKRGAYWAKTKVTRLEPEPGPKGLPTATKLWGEIVSEILQSSNPDLYVVLATAGCCKLQKLEDAVKIKSKRTHETAQLLHLLDGLNSHTRQLGVKLLIKDVPYQESSAKAAKRAAKKKGAAKKTAAKKAVKKKLSQAVMKKK